MEESMNFLQKMLSTETMKELSDKLGEELVKQINDKVGDYQVDPAKEKFIPKAVFDEDKKALKDQIAERDNQLKELGEKAKGNAEMELQIKNLQDSNKQAETEYQAKLKETQQGYGFKEALNTFKPKNMKALEGLIDKSKLTFAEDGKVASGLKEQIEALKTSDAYLFEGPAVPSGTGNPQNGGIGINTNSETEKEAISKIFNS